MKLPLLFWEWAPGRGFVARHYFRMQFFPERQGKGNKRNVRPALTPSPCPLPKGRGEKVTLARVAADGFGLDDDIVVSRVVAEVSFVYAQKQHAVALHDKVAAAANEDEIVVVVADYRD